MADNYKSVADVTVRADAYDPANPVAVCVADGQWSREQGAGPGANGHYVMTSGGPVKPKAGDYIITKGSNTFVIDATTFALLFITV